MNVDQRLTNRQRLAASWDANAEAWARAVRQGLIESRRVATDRAILDVLAELGPQKVLDVGCGEGWLTAALARQGIAAMGIDRCARLIDAARERGAGKFRQLAYADIVNGARLPGQDFDAIVCSFALFEDDDDVVPLLARLQHWLAPGGALIVQTVHPDSAPECERQDGWRIETFAGMSTDFPAAMPWYYRTLSSWRTVFNQAGFAIDQTREPTHPTTGERLSVVFVCRDGRGVASSRAPA